MFMCNQCGAVYTRKKKDNLVRHRKNSCRGNINFAASTATIPEKAVKKDQLCAKRRKVDKEDNVKLASKLIPIHCNTCNIDVASSSYAGHCKSLAHKARLCQYVENRVELVKSAYKKRIAVYRVTAIRHHLSYSEFFDEVADKIKRVIQNELLKHKSIKLNLELFGNFVQQTQDLTDIKSFNTANKIVNEASDLNGIYDDFAGRIESKGAEFQERDSGWAIEKILFVEININKYNPMRASSYIKLPRIVELKKAVINVQNVDEHCFAWSVISAIYQTDNAPQRTSSYPHYSTALNVEGMTFPAKLRDVPKFENNNLISINVYGLEASYKDGKQTYVIVGPLYYTSEKKARHINLLLITDNMGNSHYCSIKDMSRLIRSQLTKHKGRTFRCDGCLQYFGSEWRLNLHQAHDCNHLYTEMPTTKPRVDKYGKVCAENKLKFENFEKQMKVPFVVYADFESLLKPVQTCVPNPENKFTCTTEKHEPYSFGYYIKCSFDDSVSKFVSYRGGDCVKKFKEKLESDVKELYDKYLQVVVPMTPLTDFEDREVVEATMCCICQRALK